MSKTVQFTGYLFCLLPIALLTGPFLSDTIISIIAIVFLICSIRDKNWKYYNNYFFYFFIFIYCYFILRSLFSNNILLSLESSFFYFRFIFFALGVWYLLDQNKKILYLFTYFLLFSFLISLLDGYYQYFNRINSDTGIGVNIFGFKGVESRLTLLLSNELILGGLLSRLFPLLFALTVLVFNENKFIIIFSLTLMVAIDILVYLSGERTALALMLLSTIFIITLIKKFKYLRIIALVISIASIVSISILDENIKQRNIDKTITQMNLDGSSKEDVFFSIEHDSIMRTAIQIFKENPIFGIGPKLFRVECKNINNGEGCSTHPHNSYLQLLAETGIIGFGFMLILFISIIIIFLKNIYESLFRENKYYNDFQICLLICIFLTVWPLVPTNNLFNNWINVIYFLPVGFFLYSIQSNK